MKPYGRLKRDCQCCPGHDKFPSETYRNRLSRKAHSRDTRLLHKVARARWKDHFNKNIDI